MIYMFSEIKISIIIKNNILKYLFGKQIFIIYKYITYYGPISWKINNNLHICILCKLMDIPYHNVVFVISMIYDFFKKIFV